MVTWNSINFDHPSVGILGIPKFMLISCLNFTMQMSKTWYPFLFTFVKKKPIQIEFCLAAPG